MRLRRRLIWTPLALAAALIAASAPSQADIMVQPAPTPAPYNYFGPDPYYGPGIASEPGQCYVDSLRGRVCVD